MMSDDLIEKTTIKNDDFYDVKNWIVFDTLKFMKENKLEISDITLKSELKKSHKRKNFWVDDIYMSCIWTSSFFDDEQRIKHYSKQRKIIHHAQNIVNQWYDKAEMSDMGREVDNILNILADGGWWSFNMQEQVATAIEDVLAKKRGITTWFQKLDNIIPWYKPWQLVIIAWRPWAGKTAFMVSKAYEQAKAWLKVWLLSLEMSSLEIIHRIFSMWGNIPFGRIASGSTTKEDNEKIWDVAMDIIDRWMLIVDDCFTMDWIRNKLKSLVSVHWCQIVYIDYLQLIYSWKKSQNRNNEVSEMTRELKMLAKQLNIPLIVWSQLSRNVEGRIDKRPVLADLRDSWSIEQDADIVQMIHREDYYDTDSPPNWVVDVVIRKHRNWAIGDIPLHFNASTMAIQNEKPTPF